MSPAFSVRIAEAIAAELRGHTFTLSPKVSRLYMQGKDLLLTEANTLRVDVQVGDCETEFATRALTQYTCRTDIAVRKKFVPAETVAATGKIDVAEIDRLILLTQQIHDFFSRDSDNASGRRLANYEEAAFQNVEFRPLYFPNHLRENRQYTGIVAVTFQVIA